MIFSYQYPMNTWVFCVWVWLFYPLRCILPIGIGYGYECDTHTQYSENIRYECMPLTDY